MKKYILPVACLLLMKPLVVFSQLDPIIVTATRTAQTVDDTLASVTIITRDDIEEQQASSVQDLLRVVPGIDIVNNGGAGKSTSVHIRGTNSGHVLVLIDGVKVGSATLGETAFQHIPIEQIDRIEIVRGPRSSLYGSEAIGGVIQIFTRNGGGETKPNFSIGAGSNGTYSASAGISGGGEKSWYSFGASHLYTDGFNACTSDGSFGCGTVEPDKDSYSNQSASLRVGYRFDSGLDLEANLLQSNSETEYDGGFTNESESEQNVMSSTLRYAPTENWQLSLQVARSNDDSDDFKDGVFMTRYNTQRTTSTLQNDITIDHRHLLTVGFDNQGDKVVSSDTYAETKRNNQGVFVQYQGTVATHELQLSARRDDNEQFGTENTGSIAWGKELESGMMLTANIGTAFKAPTFNDLYYPFYGVETLRPETSQSAEFGWSHQTVSLGWSINIYQTDIEDLIAYDSSIYGPANINNARIRGIEANLSTQLKQWLLNTNLTLLDPTNISNDANSGNQLARRAKQSLNLNASKQYGGYKVGVTIAAVGKRYDDLANTVELDSYTTVDLRIDYLVAKNWAIQAKAENLTDEDYQTAHGYNQPERSFYLTLRYQP